MWQLSGLISTYLFLFQYRNRFLFFQKTIENGYITSYNQVKLKKETGFESRLLKNVKVIASFFKDSRNRFRESGAFDSWNYDYSLLGRKQNEEILYVDRFAFEFKYASIWL